MIYSVSMHVVVAKILRAPALAAYERRLLELTREHVAGPGGFFGITRQPEAEGILASIVEQRDLLPEDGLARHLVDVHLQRPDDFTLDQVVGQLWLLTVSAETQATATSSLVGLLLEAGELDYAAGIVDDPDAMALLIAEGGWRGIVFPASMVIATRPFTCDGVTVPAGTPCLASYAAANLDPDRFERPLDFDPRLERDVEHVAFGEGAHRCQGEVGAEQFVEDVLGEILRALPRTAFLDGGTLLRETGISMSVPRLPVNPR